MSENDRLTKSEIMLSHAIEVNNANTINIQKLFDIVNKQNLDMATVKMAVKQAENFNRALLKVVFWLGAPVVAGLLGLVGNTLMTSYNQQVANRPAQHGSP